MPAIDMMRHWGRGYVEENSDSEGSEFDAPLPTILEEEPHELAVDDDMTVKSNFSKEIDGEDTTEVSEDMVYDQEYGDEDEDDEEEHLEEESDHHNQTKSMNAYESKPLCNFAGGPDDDLLNNATPGKYRTVSVFGGIFDMEGPGACGSESSDGFSSDGFSSSDDELSPIRTKQAKPRAQRMMPKKNLKPPLQDQNQKETVPVPLEVKVQTKIAIASSEVTEESTVENEKERCEDKSPAELETNELEVNPVKRRSPKSTKTNQLISKSLDALGDREKEQILSKLLNDLCFVG